MSAATRGIAPLPAQGPIRVAVAERSAKATDLGGNLGLGNIRGFGGLSGYGNTNEGKVVAAAFLDAYNKLVDQVSTIRGK